jgi:hypothetical protein
MSGQGNQMKIGMRYDILDEITRRICAISQPERIILSGSYARSSLASSAGPPLRWRIISSLASRAGSASHPFRWPAVLAPLLLAGGASHEDHTLRCPAVLAIVNAFGQLHLRMHLQWLAMHSQWLAMPNAFGQSHLRMYLQWSAMVRLSRQIPRKCLRCSQQTILTAHACPYRSLYLW